MTSAEDLLRALRRVIPRPRPPLKVRLAEGVWTLVVGLAFVYMLAWWGWSQLRRRVRLGWETTIGEDGRIGGMDDTTGDNPALCVGVVDGSPQPEGGGAGVVTPECLSRR